MTLLLLVMYAIGIQYERGGLWNVCRLVYAAGWSVHCDFAGQPRRRLVGTEQRRAGHPSCRHLADDALRDNREALIYLAEKEAQAVAASYGVTPEQVLSANIGYQNAKAVDLQITALRAQIQALS